MNINTLISNKCDIISLSSDLTPKPNLLKLKDKMILEFDGLEFVFEVSD